VWAALVSWGEGRDDLDSSADDRVRGRGKGAGEPGRRHGRERDRCDEADPDESTGSPLRPERAAPVIPFGPASPGLPATGRNEFGERWSWVRREPKPDLPYVVDERSKVVEGGIDRFARDEGIDGGVVAFRRRLIVWLCH
jgi:hypothetical protein